MNEPTPGLEPRLRAAVEELMEIVRQRYPEAQFRLSRDPDDKTTHTTHVTTP
jgi:hypothetical protein